MKLTIRPFQRGKAAFVVEAEPSETIHDLKLRISEQGFPVETQNLLSTGKSLQDDKTISSYGIKEASSLVLMIKAAPAAPSPSPSINNTPNTAPGTLSTPPPSAQTASASHLSVPSPAYATQATVPPDVASSIPQAISGTAQGPALNGAGIYSNVGPSQSNIDAIVGMGFSQDQAVRALRASFDNLDQAVDLLINNPDNLGAGSAPRAAQSPNFLTNGSGLANAASPQTSGLPQSLVPQDLMKMMAQQQQQQELPNLSSMSLGALGGLGGGGGGPGAATAEVSPEQIEEIRRLVAYNPILTGPLLEQIKQEDPELYNYIDGDPEKLLRALSQGGDDSVPSAPSPPVSHLPTAFPPAPARLPAPAPMPQRVMQPATETRTVSVTPEEHQAIETIIGMGFDKQTVLQAYLACDRNAERAVEFLLAGAFE
ncbi:hypothetical protein BJY52DRAFT_643047 [Lactarius psammicola]|nr:hypothetical protein BJY52DRAFT_643047 [Lactarius psammicola]